MAAAPAHDEIDRLARRQLQRAGNIVTISPSPDVDEPSVDRLTPAQSVNIGLGETTRAPESGGDGVVAGRGSRPTRDAVFALGSRIQPNRLWRPERNLVDRVGLGIEEKVRECSLAGSPEFETVQEARHAVETPAAQHHHAGLIQRPNQGKRLDRLAKDRPLT